MSNFDIKDEYLKNIDKQNEYQHDIDSIHLQNQYEMEKRKKESDLNQSRRQLSNLKANIFTAKEKNNNLREKLKNNDCEEVVLEFKEELKILSQKVLEKEKEKEKIIEDIQLINVFLEKFKLQAKTFKYLFLKHGVVNNKPVLSLNAKEKEKIIKFSKNEADLILESEKINNQKHKEYLESGKKGDLPEHLKVSIDSLRKKRNTEKLYHSIFNMDNVSILFSIFMACFFIYFVFFKN